MSTLNQRRSSKERFWRRMLRQWQHRGLSIRDFCAREDLSEPTFYAWRRTLARQDAESPRFVPVQVVPDSKPVATQEGCGSGLELVLSTGRVLRIGPGYDEPTLRRLLALLEERQP